MRLNPFIAEGALRALSWVSSLFSRVHCDVGRIELRAEDQPGFWEVRGYHNNADPWLEERYG